MALNKIKTGSITDDAVNSDKLGAGSVTNTELNKTAITGQTELAETANDADFTIIYDTSSGTLKKILRSNLKQSGPTISSISPTNAVEGDGTVTFTITGTGFTAGSSARLIGNLGKVQEFDTVTRSSTTSITSTVAFSSLEQAQEPYDVQVTTGEGISSLLANQINVDASPVFTTSAGSLGSDRFSMSGIEVNATDPDSAGNITFELQSGSLPPGITLTNTGANGGTATFTGTFSSLASSDTVHNFVLRAVDAASNTTSRSFSFTRAGPISQSFTSSGTFSVPTGVSSLDVLVVGGGGSGGAGKGGGAGAGGLVFMPDFPVTPGGTVSVTVGDGGAPVAQPGSKNGNAGQDSVFGTLTAKGGGFGAGDVSNTGPAGGPGGSGGGGSRGGAGGSATQPTQPDNSGAYGFGNAGGQAGGSNIYGGGGGGGAAAAGGSGNNGAAGAPDAPYGGDGGDGRAYTIADGTTPVYYAGGGGGSYFTGPCASGGKGLGGQGGGGNAFASNPLTTAQPGTANRGGGGGGSNAQPSVGNCSGAGGKGIVIVRY